MASFHFLRPEWLLALLPAALLAALLHRRLRAGSNDWVREVDPHLLAHLALPGRRASGQWPAVLLFAGWVAAVFAMAGPTWQKLPQPVTGRLDPLVIALSLSPSMNAPDASPSRLIAARYKIADVLQRMRGSEVALVLYSDIPFAAAPLTQDAQVVAQMLPDLSTRLMRGNANRPQDAIAMAVDLLRGAGAASGRILLVTDGPGEEPGKTQVAARTAAAEGYKVNVIGVGAEGANGAPAVDTAALTAIATAGQGTFTPLTADDRDIAAALPPVAASNGAVTDSEGFTADVWADMGPFVLLLAVLLAPLAFRRGWIAVLAVAALGGLATPDGAQAQTIPQSLPQSWADLWWRPDQQGAVDFARGDYAAAAQKFDDPAWKANALYKAGDYSGAAAALSRLPGSDYNRGNALARAGQLEEAVAAYDKALAATPDDADAKFNRDLVQKLIDARKKQEEDKKKQDEKQNQAGGGGGGQDQKKDPNKDAKPDPKSDQKQDQKPGGDKPQDAQNTPQPGGSPPPPAPLPPRRPPELAQQQPPQSPPSQSPPSKEQARQAPPDAPPPAQPPLQEPPQQPAQQPPQSPEMMAGDVPAAPVTPKAPPPPMPDDKDGETDAKPDPNAEFAAPPTAPSQVAQPTPPKPPPGAPPQVSISDDDQSREQALRQVPDDPGGLLRARIRAQYTGRPVTLSEEDAR